LADSFVKQAISHEKAAANLLVDESRSSREALMEEIAKLREDDLVVQREAARRRRERAEAELESWRHKEAEMIMLEKRGFRQHSTALSPFQTLFKRRQVSSAFAKRARSTYPSKGIARSSSAQPYGLDTPDIWLNNFNARRTMLQG